MSSIYEKLSKNKTCLKIYNNYKKQKFEKNKLKRIRGNYKFENRSKNKKKMCIILAGYKDFLWEDIFSRIEKYSPKDMDVCIVSSGLYSEKLATISKKNKWSYLSVKQNKVSLVQNIAISLFPNAEFIYKLDEDIFITKSFFDDLINMYKYVKENDNYNIGFVAPLIPINGYCNVKLLEKLDLVKDFSKKFGKPYYDSCSDKGIIKNPEIAKYMWGNTKKELKDIDKLSKRFNEEEKKYSICPIRFSIGAILFTRDVWEDMGRFMVRPGTNMGLDEEQICEYCMINSKAIVVSENTLVGHFSFGPQTNEMQKYYKSNRDIFCVKED